LVVVITDIGVHTRHLSTAVAAALVGAAVLSVLTFPAVAAVLLARVKPASTDVRPPGQGYPLD
jgi:hypothetical protein